MAKALNFNKIKKRYFLVTLPNETETTLMISTPTKDIMDEFVYLSNNYINSNNNISEDVIDDLYSLCARIMSRNKANIEIKMDDLSKLLDFEDLIIFVQSYTEFISELTNSKN